MEYVTHTLSFGIGFSFFFQVEYACCQLTFVVFFYCIYSTFRVFTLYNSHWK